MPKATAQQSTGDKPKEKVERPCRVCGRKFVIVQNHDGSRGAQAYFDGIGPKYEAVHEGEEAGRPVAHVRPSRRNQLKVALRDKCRARRERAQSA
jgi:hypothetical protein